ncbi:MAG: peptide-methionine (S)-S-oxide reductase MsrA [Verrucomicrobia bacterium]|nr:peptide-methionine (S)-S-oxide reductase MsrA [Verrucomicrobiota bacterium]
MRASSSAPITAKTPPAPIEKAPATAAPSAPVAPAQRLEVAYFGGGCFWCVEGLFQVVPGVLRVVNGYAGGTTANPTYKQVLSGSTGHAEVVQVTYDANAVSYEQLLDNFWEIHDPTQVDRQGNDVGPQYRSIILCRNEAERAQAEQSKTRQQRTYRQPIATQVVLLDKFWIAEDFHQDYFARHPGAPYCQLVIRPKLEKFQKSVGRR